MIIYDDVINNVMFMVPKGGPVWYLRFCRIKKWPLRYHSGLYTVVLKRRFLYGLYHWYLRNFFLYVNYHWYLRFITILYKYWYLREICLYIIYHWYLREGFHYVLLVIKFVQIFQWFWEICSDFFFTLVQIMVRQYRLLGITQY